MIWRKREKQYAPLEQVIYWPTDDAVEGTARIQVATPFLALHNKHGLFTSDAKDLTTNSLLKVENGDFDDFWLVDADGVAAHVLRGEDLGPTGPDRWFGQTRPPHAVRLIFDTAPQSLSAAEIKAHLYRSFEAWSGWSRMLGQPAFEEMKRLIDAANTVEQIFKVLVHFNRRN